VQELRGERELKALLTGSFARIVRGGSSVDKIALTWHDVGLVLGTLLGSLLIYVAVERLRKTD